MDSIPSNLNASDRESAEVLATAASTGDLDTVTTFLSQWPTQPSSEPVDEIYGPKPADIAYDQDLWPFHLVLHAAIDNFQPQLVCYVLSRGLKPWPLATLKALDAGSIEIFQALSDGGWNINAPLAKNMSPPLWYVELSSSSMSLSFKDDFNFLHFTRPVSSHILTVSF